MRLTLQNHIVCADYGQVHLDARVVGQIIDYRTGEDRGGDHRTIYSSVLFSGVVFENLR